MHPVSLPELERLAMDHGLIVVRVQHQADLQRLRLHLDQGMPEWTG